MPQMAPMNWILLFITFIIIFLASLNKIFYISINNFDTPKLNKDVSLLNLNLWKW